MRRLTAAEKQKIVELYTTPVDGTWPTYASIGRQVGRSSSAVENCVKRAGVARRHKLRLTEKEKQRIIELYQTRKGTRWTSTVEISHQVGRAPSTINRVVTEAGITRTVSAALSAHVSDALRARIIHIYRTTGWSYPKVAEYLDIGAAITYDVLDEADVIVRQGPNRQAKLRIREAKQIATLYAAGLSASEVAERTGRTRRVVENVARDAGILRDRSDAARLAKARRRARKELASTPMAPIAARWRTGTPVDILAAGLDVPPDLLWEEMVRELSIHEPGFTNGGREDCVGLQCILGCVVLCALSVTATGSAARR